MPITYRVDQVYCVVLAEAQGVLTDEDLRVYVETVLSDVAVRPGFNELVDLRDVTKLEVSNAGFSRVVNGILDFEQQLRNTRIALVTSARNAVEIARVHKLVGTSLPTTVRLDLFRDMSAAQAWLGLADNRGQPIRERRIAPRKRIRSIALCRSGIQEGSGQLVNISLSGALLESNSIHPTRGRFVKIRFNAPEVRATIELTGTVVRETKGSFAIQFVKTTNELLQLLGGPP